MLTNVPPVGRVLRLIAPAALLAAAVRPAAPRPARAAAGLGLAGVWTLSYTRYRKRGLARTQEEWELMRTGTLEAFKRHYNECVPTLEEELDLWGEYHGHRHQMRYQLVAEQVRRHVTGAADVLDLGCGAALVADRLADLPLRYVGLDYGGHHIETAARRHAAGAPGLLQASFVRSDAEHLPFTDASFDVVVWSEVIEHLMRPELAVWEVARVLRPGGVLVMTTNNASEMPLRFPLSDPLAFLEKALGFRHPGLISHRPWVWPWPIDRSILPEDAPDVWMPHTWHKQAETARMFAAAGMDTIHASTFEFPPPQSATAAWLDKRGQTGRTLVNALERICQSTPLLNRLGCHVLMVASRTQSGSAQPPPGIWPGPFSSGTSEAPTNASLAG
ncbi:MAG: SAM-dependent methyltransferase [Frankiales bacterium]|nr:SAM-dependent methyltransferase [Frankiales bacterium]